MEIADIRKDYKQRSLLEADVKPDAIEQFGIWWNEAVSSQIDEVNAMTLATASLNGVPSARIVLLKGYDHPGFTFFSNYNSHKAKEIADNPFVSLVFFWKELERQVRVEGTIEKISEEDSDIYFQSRPYGSRIGAWASPQSQVIPARELLENNYQELNEQYNNGDVPKPPHWGGYIVKPTLIEFWQGRTSRLHDRLQYTLLNNSWKIERLAP